MGIHSRRNARGGCLSVSRRAVAFDVGMGPLEVRDAVRDVLAPLLDVMLKGKGKG